MKAYIQTDKHGDYYNVNAFVANQGFVALGWETEKFISLEEIKEFNPEDVLVGGIANVRSRLKNLGRPHSGIEIDYPTELRSYLGRKLWESTVEDLVEDESNWNVFIKPKSETKKFAGKVVRSYNDFIGLVDHSNPTPIWCSEIVHFITEWRCYIRYGTIWDIRQYKGAWDSKIDLSIVENAIRDFKSSPIAYALDFGIDENSVMKLVEVNDGHSLGSYGMEAVKYARFLSARWAEMAGVRDMGEF
jgi:hypothetical protein